ncbi:uncharacterized protein LOC109841921 [Asparagus officinalis]|uniref:uncharacterized protein LOC109841921 n=1 Tax=Asparagus officinalis TaxID=4686 RepID=UPI00098E59EB|nr:uncharacterized protein LOC109841921 [Asparagus officinalis]
MVTRIATTARGTIGAQWGVEGLASFIEMQSGFMETQMEILEKQSEATEKLSEALNTQKKIKPIGSNFENFKKMSPPSFQGGSDPTVAQEWLKKMEKYFRALGLEEYEAKFNGLSRYAPELVAEEFDKIEMFENGLRSKIHQKVTVVMSKTFEEAVERAKRAEKTFRGSGAPVQRSGQFVQRTGPLIQRHGHIAKDCPIKKGPKTDDQKAKPTPGDGQKSKAQGRVFALTKQDALASNSVVVGALVISSQFAHVLFDSSSSHSFISHSFASKLDRTLEFLESELSVSTPSGDCMITDHIFKGCEVIVGDQTLLASLVLLDIHDFDVILGMDWISTYHSSLGRF